LRQNFVAANLSPDFRIADPTENNVLRDEVLDEVLTEFYDDAEYAEDFFKLLEAYANAKANDKMFRELVHALFQFAMSLPNPEEWLLSAADRFQITGDFECNDYVLASGAIAVQGALIINSGYVECNNAEISIGNNLDATGAYNYGIKMTHETDKITVEGDMNYDASYKKPKTAGTIAVKGNINLEKGFYASKTLTLKLCGNKKQTIAISDENRIGTLEIDNSSIDGVWSAKPLTYLSLEHKNGKLNYGEGNTNGVLGYTLSENTVINGDFYLMDGSLDLNGYSLHVSGNYIQASGKTVINGGELTVDSDFRLQLREGTDDYTYGDSNGLLVMTNENDLVNVKGDFYVTSKDSMEGMLTDGLLSIGGSFSQSGYENFVATENHKTNFYGTRTNTMSAKYTVNFDELIGNTGFNILEIDANYQNHYTFKQRLSAICNTIKYIEDTTPPTKVTNLRVSKRTGSAITLVWNASSDETELAGYRIYRDGELVEDKFTNTYYRFSKINK